MGKCKVKLKIRIDSEGKCQIWKGNMDIPISNFVQNPFVRLDDMSEQHMQHLVFKSNQKGECG